MAPSHKIGKGPPAYPPNGPAALAHATSVSRGSAPPVYSPHATSQSKPTQQRQPPPVYCPSVSAAPVLQKPSQPGQAPPTYRAIPLQARTCSPEKQTRAPAVYRPCPPVATMQNKPTQPGRVPSAQSATLLRGGVVGVVQRMELIEPKTRSDQIKGLMTEQISDTQMIADVKSVCRKVQQWALRNLGEVMPEYGRDLFFYNKSAYAWSYSWSPIHKEEAKVLHQLSTWQVDNEGAGDTVAMLMDFALAWKHTKVEGASQLDIYADQYARARADYRRTREYLEEKGLTEPLSAEELERKLNKSKQFLTDEHNAANPKGGQTRFPPSTTLGSLKASEGYDVKAGPSSSTATLLWLLRRVGGITRSEAKSVAHALATQFWGQGAKHLSGEYHTKFETTIPLARHLRKFAES
jgi:hypothetical protein